MLIFRDMVVGPFLSTCTLGACTVHWQHTSERSESCAAAL